MSFKAKDLQFDSTQPAFLRRLRGELTSGDSARHEQPIQRNKRLKQDDEDDAPTYVLGDTKESLSKEEYEALVAGKDSKDTEGETAETADKSNPMEENIKSKDRISEVGATTKKRKAAKIISDEVDESKNSPRKDSKNADAQPAKKSKKKSKAVKLTFGEED